MADYGITTDSIIEDEDASFKSAEDNDADADAEGEDVEMIDNGLAGAEGEDEEQEVGLDMDTIGIGKITTCTNLNGDDEEETPAAQNQNGHENESESDSEDQTIDDSSRQIEEDPMAEVEDETEKGTTASADTPDNVDTILPEDTEKEVADNEDHATPCLETGDKDTGMTNTIPTSTSDSGHDDTNTRTDKSRKETPVHDDDENSDEITILEPETGEAEKSKESAPSSSVPIQTQPIDSNAQENLSDAFLDLELDCVDEPLEEDQLLKAKNMRMNFENMMKDVAKLKKQTRILTANRPGSQLLGIGTKRAPVSLVRPVMPTPTSSLNVNTVGPQMQQQAYRIVHQSQHRQISPTTYSVAPRIISRNPGTSVQPVQFGNPAMGQMGQVIRTSTGMPGTFQQVPSLLYDTNSGLLLMPAGGPVVSSNTNVMTMNPMSAGMRYTQPNTLISSTANTNFQGRAVPIRPNVSGVQQQVAHRAPVQRVYQGSVQMSRPPIVPALNAPRTSSPATSNNLARPGLPTRVVGGVPAQVNRPIRPSVIQQTNTLQGRVGMAIRSNAPPTRLELTQNKPLAPRPQTSQEKVKAPAAYGPGGDDNTKTFPSLVVNVKPCLLDKPTKADLQKARTDLDARVKTLLVYSPSKFTEWLMQRGLLRLEHKCSTHQTPENQPVAYKLGMYSDGNKQPFSGGYVWISECCPDKQISVFQGSIFEASVYPPGTMFKLIYHWSCQTTATNVLLWVKVTSYYLKNFYTLLRSACVAALHELGPEMGGPKKFVEVGIITLGTSMPNQANGAKQVKVEILGVFDPATKAIRLKVVNPQNNPPNSNASQNRVLQILWPLRHWVHKESTILIDTGIERSLILEMGFNNVLQSKNGVSPKPGSPTNVNVMNYLKHIVPKMFQNTLCVLSKSLIQQFLDELCWRELWGHTPASTYDNMINHLVQMTKWDTGEPLITRLNRISLNPFGEWSYNRNRTGIEMLPDSISGGGLEDFASLNVQQISGQFGANSRAGNSNSVSRSATTPFIPNLNGTSQSQPVKRRAADDAQLLREQHEEFNQILRTQPRALFVHSYYYAESMPENIVPPAGFFPQTLRCPLCSKQFLTNLEVVRHIFTHVHSLGFRNSQRDSTCDYCMKDVAALGLSLSSHVNDVHKLTLAPFPCLICQEKFSSERNMILHMWENHCKQDMPYRCEVCDFKSSFHYDIVDHFMREHKGYDCVVCPHCLKVMTAKSFACMKQIVVHLQSHSIKKGKKCPHCILVFTSDVDFNKHLVEGAHQYFEDNCAGYIVTAYQNDEFDIKMPKPPERILTKNLPPPVKRSRTDEPKKTLNVYKPALQSADGGATQIEEFRSKYTLPSGLPKCIECGEKMNNPNHFPAFISCIKCRFSTSCRVSMDKHLQNIHPPSSADSTEPPVLKPSLKVKATNELQSTLTCSCKFATKNPVEMAQHLVKCEKYTAYCETEFPTEDYHPTQSTAKSTEKTPQSFLDQLGLSRNADAE